MLSIRVYRPDTDTTTTTVSNTANNKNTETWPFDIDHSSSSNSTKNHHSLYRTSLNVTQVYNHRLHRKENTTAITSDYRPLPQEISPLASLEASSVGRVSLVSLRDFVLSLPYYTLRPVRYLLESICANYKQCQIEISDPKSTEVKSPERTVVLGLCW